MRPSILASFLFTLSLTAQAEGLLLADIEAQNAIQLSVGELKQLMPNASVTSLTEAGSTRYWKNDPDGTFVASSDSRGQLGKRGGSAHGTWHVGDNGTYCVTLEWKSKSENWCRYIFKVEEKYYGVKSVADRTTKAHEFAFSK